MLGSLFAAAAVVWLGTLVYVVVLLQRQKHLQLELDDVKHMLEELQNESNS